MAGTPLRIGVTCGDCNGIGLEVFLKAMGALPQLPTAVQWYLFVHPETLEQTIRQLQLSIPITFVQATRQLRIRSYAIQVIAVEPKAKVQFGTVSAEAAQLASNALKKSVEWLREQRIDALVTLPVAKYALAQVGFDAAGQTDWLASQFQVQRYLMLFWSAAVIIVLATIHVPLQRVPEMVSAERLEWQLRLLSSALQQDFGVRIPSIAVLGLNPHAGEQGLLGTEEEAIITPVVQRLQQEGMYVYGPFSADAFFGRAQYRRFSAVMAMYHDQGLIPLKLLAQGAAVNITVGLPFVRTSPDHGTAYDIAGKGVAEPASCIAALQKAVELAQRRQSQ